jgi:hypothetical protein
VQTYAPPRPVGATARQLGGRRATGLARDIGGGFGDSALRHHQAMMQVGHFPADRDARISVTDRCNFRCAYCMPRASFGPGHAFMRRQETLTTNEIVHPWCGARAPRCAQDPPDRRRAPPTRQPQRELPGVAEAMRAAGLAKTGHALLSRQLAGVMGTTLLLALPGRAGACTDCLDAVWPALPHALAMLRTGAHP